MAAANRELIRSINQSSILDAIRTAGAISRVEIAGVTGQSKASVTNITAQLIQKGLIYEKKTVDSAQRGRRRVLLALNPDAAYVVGVKLSAFRISCAVTDMQAEVKSSIIMPVRTSKRPVQFIADLIEEGIRHCVAKARLSLEKISGIGIGVPGFVDSRSGVCYWTPLYQNEDVPLMDLIRNKFNITTYIENDSNTLTLAHQWFGEGRKTENFLVVTIEEGVGMGIVVNGKIHRGARGIAGEFGHMVVDPEGALCRCGKKGCIEAYANYFSILKAAKLAYEAGEWHFSGDTELTIEDVRQAARDGDPTLLKIFDRAGYFLGIGLSCMIQVFNPTRIIISGQGVKAGDLLFERMRKTIRINTNRELFESVEIVIEKWRDTDWARGAACLALQEFYKSPVS